jgi:uncharacterized NAD-dependent epimerase/dehydratase family protein
MRRFSAEDRIALLMHEQIDTGFGKLGQGMLRYSNAQIAAVIDRKSAGGSIPKLTGIHRDAPIVASVSEARALGAEILIVGIAPPGGQLPTGWRDEIKEALSYGMSVVNPLHGSWETDPELTALLSHGNWIWDVRIEPPDLMPATGKAANMLTPRVLSVGTDMSVGKMTACLELQRSLCREGLEVRFVATGQVGICIAGSGVPLDAIRLDYATGAIEREVVSHEGADIILIEGQGALCHPASTATLALMRGSMPTHLLFVARAGQQTLKRMQEFQIPRLTELIKLNESLAGCCGAFPQPKTIGIALNTADMNEQNAMRAIDDCSAETGLPVSDPVRFGCEQLTTVIRDICNKQT